MPKWLDAHTHLDGEELYPEIARVLERAAASGVSRMLVVNSEATAESFERTLSLAAPDGLPARFVALGVHPHNASLYSEALEKKLVELLRRPGVIGLGEIGLDFYYNYSPQDVQVQVLRRQLELARQAGLPVVIHCRDAYGLLADVLAQAGAPWTGMIHCFTGNVEEARRLLDLGFFISFSGMITFKKAGPLRDVARTVPPSRMLIETDAPYLAPVPHRGKRNEPAFVAETGKFLAQELGVSADELAERVWQNFDSLFVSAGSIHRRER